MKEHNLSIEDTLKDYIQKHKKYNFIKLSNLDSSSSVDLSSPIIKSQEKTPHKLKEITLMVEELKNIDIKLIGASYLLKHISDNVGLTKILMEVFPQKCQELLSLAFFYSIENDALRYCKFFIDFFDDNVKPTDLTSQRTSEILSRLSDSEKFAFYDKWSHHI
ncbi:MAG: hypothetical protein LBF22_02750 [Deltaproteobacteria bacterium]|jgi:hypothetical protein|nr:hypothetical protein [Deltaproteobacteria bacterium]